MKRSKILSVVGYVVLALALVLPAQSQHFQAIGGAKLTQISVGSVYNIWGVNAAQQIFQFNPATQSFNQIPGLLVQIAVGGGNLVQPDAVWGVNSSQQIFQYWGNAWHQIAGALTTITVGSGHGGCYPYEVWGLNTYHQAFRFNTCTGKWELGIGGLNSITTVGGEVWATGAGGINGINFYRFDFSTLGFYLMPIGPTQIAVSSGGVWGSHYQGFNSSTWQFNPNTQSWSSIPGVVKGMFAGGNEVWALGVNNQPMKYFPNSQSWTSFPGKFSTLAIGNGGGIWALDSSGNAYTFMTP